MRHELVGPIDQPLDESAQDGLKMFPFDTAFQGRQTQIPFLKSEARDI
jgi:hypothetical protein